MSHSLRRWLAAGAVASAMMAAAPVSAAPIATPDQIVARAPVSFVQYRGGYGYRRGPSGGAVAAGVIGGLAVGALVGGALAAPSYGPPAYGPPPAPVYGPPPAPAYAYGPPPAAVPVGNVYGRDPHWVQYCASRYPGFDPISGTFVGRDGYRYPCR